MKLTSFKLAALAAVSLAAFAQSANAATITTTTGDLLLAVYQTNSAAAGYGKVYEVDLGSLTGFSASQSNIDLSGRVSITDINNTFTTGVSSLSYFVVATQGNGTLQINGTTPKKNSILITDASVPPTSDANSSTLGSNASNIGGLVGAISGQSSTANSNYGIVLSENTPTNNAPTFGLGGGVTTLVPFSGTSNFYLLNNGNAVNPQGTVAANGTFSFVNGTTFTFNPTVQTVPEPSTYALMGLGALLLIITARRRMVSNS